MIILGLSGFARSGKDSLGRILVSQEGFTRISFADKVREFSYNLNPPITHINKEDMTVEIYSLRDIVDDIGWERAKDEYPSVRQFLINVGHGARTTLYEDIWINLALPLDGIYPSRVVVTDVRYDNEIQRIKDLGGLHIRIHREGVEAPFNHVTERHLEADYTIENIEGDPESMLRQIKDIIGDR